MSQLYQQLQSYAYNTVILDTETTGLDDGAEIIEIAVIDTQGYVLLNTLVKPSRPFNDFNEAAQIHGIRYAELENAPSWPQVQERLLEIIRDKTILIYNAAFDTRLMNQSARAHGGGSIEYPAVCLMQLYSKWFARQYGGSIRRHRQVEAAAHCGVDTGRAHRALDDCRTALGIWRYMRAHCAGMPVIVNNNPITDSNLYQLLGISDKASFKDILKAIKYAAENQRLPLKVLQDAKRRLMNPDERQRYDAELSALKSAKQPAVNNVNTKKQPIVIKNNNMTINYDASLWENLPLGLKLLMPQFQELNFDFQSEMEKKIYQSIMEILRNNKFDVSFCRMCHYGRDRFISFNCYFPILLFCVRNNTIQVYSNRTITYYKKLGISASKPHSKYVNWRTLVRLESVGQLIKIFQDEIIFSYQRAATAFNLMSLDFSAEQEDYIAAYLSRPSAWVYYKHYPGIFKRADEFLTLSGIGLKNNQ